MEKKDRKIIVCLFLLAAVFLLIAFAIRSDFLTGFDKQISNFFVANQSQNLILFMKSVSFLGSVEFLFVFSIIVLIFFYFNRTFKSALFYLFNLFSGLVLSESIKKIFGRIRPVNPYETDFSFPSGHTLMSAVIYGSLVYLLWNKNRKLSYTFMAFILIIGFSRIYLNMHWFSDAIGSYVLGFLILCFSVWLFFDKTFK